MGRDTVIYIKKKKKKKAPYTGSENRSELCGSSSLVLSTSDFPDWIPELEALQ